MQADHDYARKLVVSADMTERATVLSARGTLDRSTYLPLRDAIIKAALDGAAAVIVDVTTLRVPAGTAWSVFTSARWLVSEWPDVPMALVCAHGVGRDEIYRNGVTRYVPVFSSKWEAAGWLSQQRAPERRRRRVELPRTPASVKLARDLVEESLIEWSRPEWIPIGKLVVTVLVENVLAHTDSAPTVRIELHGMVVAVIAVEDSSSVPAVRREPTGHGEDVCGLSIVAALCRKWGNSPTLSGKTVWAAIGPENQL